MNQTITAYIRTLLANSLGNKMFEYSDLNLPIGTMNAATQALNRMVKSGEINRVFKGKFVVASLYANRENNRIDEIIAAICRFRNKASGYQTGQAIWVKFGLLPANTEIGVYHIATQNVRPPQVHAGNKICFLKAKLDPSKSNIRVLQLLDAVEHFKNLAKIVGEQSAIDKLKFCFSELGPGEQILFADYALAYRPATRALAGYILEETGQVSYAERLKMTLHPVSRYKLNIEENLHKGISKWNIV